MDAGLLIPVALSVLVVMVLFGLFLAGAFKPAGLDKNAIQRVMLATAWAVRSERVGTRDRTIFTPSDGSWRLTLSSAERLGSGGSGGAAAVRALGGAGTAWYTQRPALSAGIVAITRGEPLPEGAENDVLAGPLGGVARALIEHLMPEIAGGPAPAPKRLVAFRTGDAAFDAAHTLVSDDPALARRVVTATLRDALSQHGDPSLVISSAGVQIGVSGPPVVDAERLRQLVACGLEARAVLAAALEE